MRIIFAISLIIVLSSCQPDPRKEADAYATRLEADQQAMNDEQARQQSDELHQLELQRLQNEQQIREETQRQWTIARQRIISVFGWVASISLVIVGLCVAVAFGRASIGISNVMVESKRMRANLIYPDPVTGLFPHMRHVHGDRFYIFDGNSHSVMKLDEPKAPNSQMISALQVTSVAGVLARSAERSEDPAGMAMITPPVVSVKNKELTLGADFYQEGDNS
jgi:hypothetical protein